MSGTSNPKFLAVCIGVAADGLLDSNDTAPEALNCVIAQLSALERDLPIPILSSLRVSVQTRHGLERMTLSRYKYGCRILRDKLVASNVNRDADTRKAAARALNSVANILLYL